MNTVKITAIVLIVAGVPGLMYGSFTYTRETHQANPGSLDLSVTERETVNVPLWAGVGAIVTGGWCAPAGWIQEGLVIATGQVP